MAIGFTLRAGVFRLNGQLLEFGGERSENTLNCAGWGGGGGGRRLAQ